MRTVIYSRVSTDEQSPKSQLNTVLNYAKEKGYEVIKIFEENISGSVDPLIRPVFRKLLDYIKANSIEVILMYDLTRFYRAASPVEALTKLRQIMNEYEVLIDFAKEPEIGDPLMRELWMFIKSWFATYERIQVSLRTKYGMSRVKREGRLYHKPDLAYYYAAWLYNKDVGEVSRNEYLTAKKTLKSIILKYWNNPSIKKTKIISLLMNNELRDMYNRFPKAPKSYLSIYRLLKSRIT